MGEYYAAGLYEEHDATLFERFSRAMRRYLEHYELQQYHGEPLYPCGKKWKELAVCPDFSNTVKVNWDPLETMDPDVADALKKDIRKYISAVPAEHSVGGNMYTHSYPNFRRIIREGLDSYEQRVRKMCCEELRRGLLDVIAGIRCFHGRLLQKLAEEAGESELCRALQKVPFRPADNLYEALVSWNFIYYLDGCDNIGRPDADLIDFYQGEDVTQILRCFFRNVDANDGWSGALGPDYNALTLQCLKAGKGMRRPSLELRVTSEMPQKIWDAAITAIQAGGGSPSLYNETGYQQALERLFPEIPKEDRLCFAGGGCTETMLAGLSNVGSLDAGVNVALIFERFMREALPSASCFEEFYRDFIRACCIQIEKVLDAVSESQKRRARFRPNPMRTLLIDDCIDREKDFNDGGARYHWSVINLAGMINVLDSLLVIRQLVFTEHRMSGTELLQRLDRGENFLDDRKIPRHGTDSAEANAMAKRLSADLLEAFESKVPYAGGRFLPSSIQFTTYTEAGRAVGATPDGRRNGAPLCDCIGAVHGNDRSGATALLNSAASLCQEQMAGTPVLNIRLEAAQVEKSLKALVCGYFEKGGMQMQVTCVKKEELLDAKRNPDKYPNLIVRIGGYSEYFNRLSPQLQQTVIDRTIFGD